MSLFYRNDSKRIVVVYDVSMQPIELKPGEIHTGPLSAVSGLTRGYSCVCSATGVKPLNGIHKDGYIMTQCVVCGVKRLSNLPGEYPTVYTNGMYHETIYRKNTGMSAVEKFDHDYDVGKKRVDALKEVIKKGKLLDVGAGTGAFVKAAGEAGFEAIGVDISPQMVRFAREEKSLDVRQGTLVNQVFDGDYFDVICYNDTLEHILDVAAELEEITRILKPGGIVVIETPDVGCADFKKDPNAWRHFKPIEHLWYFDKDTLTEALGYRGITVKKSCTPIRGKLAMYTTNSFKKDKNSVHIKIPAGIGDAAWVFMKLTTLKQTYKVEVSYEGPKRTLPLMRMLSCVTYSKEGHFGNNQMIDLYNRNPLNGTWRNLGSSDNGTGLFIQANTHLEGGRRIEEWLPDLKTDFHFPLRIYKNYEKAGNELLKEGVIPIGIYSSSRGPQGYFFGSWRQPQWLQFMYQIKKTIPEVHFYLIGADFDRPFYEALSKSMKSMQLDHTNVVGYPLPVAAHVIKNTKHLFAFPSGIGILGHILKVPTTMFYSPVIQKIAGNWGDPEYIEDGRLYEPMWASPKDIFNWFTKEYKFEAKLGNV